MITRKKKRRARKEKGEANREKEVLNVERKNVEILSLNSLKDNGAQLCGIFEGVFEKVSDWDVRRLTFKTFSRKKKFHQKWASAYLPCRIFLFIKSCTFAAVGWEQTFQLHWEQHCAMKLNISHQREYILQEPETNKQTATCMCELVWGFIKIVITVSLKWV